MRIAVIGGTGTIGRRIATGLAAEGHEVRPLSRHSQPFAVDLTTGAGLEQALEGCEVVVDASNGPRSGKARPVLVDGSRRLLGVEHAAGVHHHVCVSIVGIDDVPLGYYRIKVEQERTVRAGAVPWTIVRATQFHDLVDLLFSTAGRVGVVPAGRQLLQPVDVSEAAHAVAGVALGPPRHGVWSVAGPEVQTLRQLASSWREARGRRVLELPVFVPGRLGRALREGRLTCASPDQRATTSFARWLAQP